VERPGDAPVVVISDRFWRNRLHSSPNALGQILHLNGQIATIVGITPKNFNGALSINPSELFVPITPPLRSHRNSLTTFSINAVPGSSWR
jgi:hypothetical protein